MNPPRKVISVVTPCYNEEANVIEVYERVKAVFESDSRYSYEHIFIAQDLRVKAIVNARNFATPLPSF